MDRKSFNRFCVLALAAAFLTFAALGGGGCGGSGSRGGATRNLSNSDIAPYLPVVAGDIYQELVDEYVEMVQDSAAAKAALDKVDFYAEAADEEEEEPIENMVQALNDGRVLALVYPDAELINDFLEDMGVKDKYIRPAGDVTDYLELFAVAQRTVKGEPQIFTYSIADLKDFAVLSNTLTSADFPPADYVANQYAGDFDGAEPDVIVGPMTAEVFQKLRVKDFLAWVAGLDETAAAWESGSAAETAAAPVQTAAAVDELSQLASVIASPKFQFNYSWDDVKKLGIGWRTTRESNLNYKIWSLHSFDTKEDYFVIELDAATDPSSQFSSWLYQHDTVGYSGRVWKRMQRAMGLYTLQLTFDHELVGGENTVTLSNYAPQRLNKTYTTTQGFTEKFGTKIGMGKTPSLNFEHEITYSSSVSDTYHDYEIAVEANKNRAKWVYDFVRPTDGKRVAASGDSLMFPYIELVASEHITKKHDSKMRWIWTVAPEYWTGGRKAATVNVTYTWAEGASYGTIPAFGLNGSYREISRSSYTPVTISKQAAFELPRPAHLTVRPTALIPTLGNSGLGRAAGNASLQILSESDWTIRANADWISGFSRTTGGATGSTPANVVFGYGANDTGVPRTANVILSNTEGDEVVVEVIQGSN